MPRPDLRGLRVAITGERRAEEQAALVRALGGVPFVCPTVRVTWAAGTADAQRWLETLLGGVDDVVFMTGMGAGRLLQHAAQMGDLEAAVSRLRAARVVVRGSKALPLLRRHDVDVDLNPKPSTTEGVLAALGDSVRGRRVLVQLAGPLPSPLVDGMRAAGAGVVAVCIYDYPADAPGAAAHPLIAAILDAEVDAVTFTSAPAVDGLVAAAVREGRWPEVRERLGSLIVASVGPVTGAALRSHGVPVHVQPEDPHTGPMMSELARLVGRR
jgi:uroporphyrinogen-III synthase